MFNFIFGKKYESINAEFMDLLSKAYFHIKNREFNKAVALYNDIYDKYSKLSENQKTEKLQRDIDTLVQELKLYMEINNAFLFAQEGDMKYLREQLDKIHDLAYEIEYSDDTATILEYSSEKYKFLLDIYTTNLTQKHFEDAYKKAEKLVQEKKNKEALKIYSQLIILYKKIADKIDQDKKVEFYFNLRKLFKQFTLHHLFNKPSRKQKVIKEVDFEATYEKIHDALKKGDMKTVSKLYKQLES